MALVPVPTISGAGGNSCASVVAQEGVVATSTAEALVPVPTIAGDGGDSGAMWLPWRLVTC